MKGFCTLAVGDEKYYRLAGELLKSYRLHTKDPVPFIIYADRENEYTEQFDGTVILDHASGSYMDKLTILSRPYFEYNIFIDSDCLCFGDINEYWDYFPRGGVSCFGSSLPLNSEDGWFLIDDTAEYKEKIEFIPQMHGGIIFFRDDEITRSIFRMSITVSENFGRYRFKYFDKPADEPILALCMAVHGVRPVEIPAGSKKMFVFYPTVEKLKCNILTGIVSYEKDDGDKFEGEVLLIHWQNLFTESVAYKREIYRMEAFDGNNCKKISVVYRTMFYAIGLFVKRNLKRGLNKMKKMVHGA